MVSTAALEVSEEQTIYADPAHLFGTRLEPEGLV